MKKIILPTDFSDNARNAMNYAAALFQDEPVQYTLLNAYHVVPASVDLVNGVTVDPASERALESLNDELHAFSKLPHHPDSSFAVRSGYGDPTDLIVIEAKDNRADFVVMGTQGASGLREFLLGSNAAGTALRATCPVITVPEGAQLNDFDRLMLAADLKAMDVERTLQPLNALADKFKATVMLLNVHHPEAEPATVDEGMEGLGLMNYFSDNVPSFHTNENESIEDGILEFAHNEQVDMIALVKRDHNLWERLFTKSLTKQLAFHSDLPLLVLPG